MFRTRSVMPRVRLACKSIAITMSKNSGLGNRNCSKSHDHPVIGTDSCNEITYLPFELTEISRLCISIILRTFFQLEFLHRIGIMA